jgi:hypothetical protein
MGSSATLLCCAQRFTPSPRRLLDSVIWYGVRNTALALLAVLWFVNAETANAQIGGFIPRAVGGVTVDAEGLLRSATLDQRQASLESLRQAIGRPQGDIAEPAEMRMISLSKLQQAMEARAADGKPLSDEMRHLAGLQRVQYVFVYPERNDIVLAGPAEAWVVREDASVVGAKSGRPVMKLDDLVVALRSVEPARTEGISCSIEPTAEGRQRLQNLLKRVNLRPGQNPASIEPAMREAFGPQLIKLSGVPETSHYARTMVAADYQMKRLAMALEASPVPGLPSYLEMSKAQRHSAQSNPRWWMACNYDALSHTEDKLAWRISGQGIKTLTETDLIAASGQATRGTQIDKMASKWAEAMTQRFDDLAKNQAVFGELRNCFDLSVVATLIVQEQLAQRANCDLSHLMGHSGQVELEELAVPRMVEPQCSFIRGSTGWIVTASGGVEVNAFEVVESQQVDPSLVQSRSRAAADESLATWWWNG